MIRVVLSGGIGNQLFQYAAGRALALKRNTNLIVDRPTAKLTSVRRIYAMPRFHVLAQEAALSSSIYRKWALKNRLSFLLRGDVFYQEGSNFSEAFFDLPDDITLFGFFQNERYFKPFASFIQDELTFRDYPLERETEQMAASISQDNSVSVHVRRGDAYLSSEKFNVCTLSYYQTAIKLYRKKLESPTFYFFSDDISWCIKNFQGGDFIFCDLQQSRNDSINDLRLMSMCKHNIIANSTFSWWAAWLNPNLNKVIAAPSTWFQIPNDPVNQIVCRSWFKIEL
ncbi:alpha-1,2-fucosyltransferase [soil metagenome]